MASRSKLASKVPLAAGVYRVAFLLVAAEGADHHGMEADAVFAEVANFLLDQQDLHLEVFGIALFTPSTAAETLTVPPLRPASIFTLGFRRRLEIFFQIFLETLEDFGSHVARSAAYGLLAVDGEGRHAVRAVESCSAPWWRRWSSGRDAARARGT